MNYDENQMDDIAQVLTDADGLSRKGIITWDIMVVRVKVVLTTMLCIN